MRAPRALGAIVLVTALALSPILLAGYLCFDDFQHILENPNLQSTSVGGLLAFWTRPYFALYIPLTYSLWWLLSAPVHLLGATLQQSAWVFHGLNLLLHLGNTVLVFWLVRTLLERRLPSQPATSDERVQTLSLAAALLFALHPVQVESVAWIAECKGDLSTLLGLLGLLAYYRSPRRYPTAVLFVAAMLAKPSALVFPGVLLIVNRVLLRRSGKTSAAFPALLWLLLLPLALLTRRLQPEINIDFVPSVGQRLLVASDALTFYLRKLVVPASLALDYGRSPRVVLTAAHAGAWRALGPAIVALTALAVSAHALARPPARPWRAFVTCGLSVFVLALAPVLGLIPFEFQDFSTVADHYMLVSMLGAALMLVGVLVRAAEASRTRAVLAGVVVLLVGLGVASFRQAGRWRSTETLFSHTLLVNPRSYLAHYSIAVELTRSGRQDEGMAEDAAALAINPDYLHAQVALGAALIQKRNFQAAVDHYVSALARNPSPLGKRGPLVASLHNNLGIALYLLGRRGEATQQFQTAVAIDPQSALARANVARAVREDGGPPAR
jgi:tetratricopeptide (TPR) repeat protein